MKLFSRNAEALLNEKVKNLANSHDSWRSIYIKFSGQVGAGASVLTNMIVELLGDDEGLIYLCDDADVFILFQGQVEPVLGRLGGHIKDLDLGSESAVNKDNQYIVFDLSTHWESFRKLVESKLPIKIEIEEFLPPVEILPLPEVNKARFESAARKRRQRQRLSVLLVEDDPFTRRLVQGVLKNDFDIIEAGSGIAAIQAYEDYAPDCVFLDIGLPDVSGQELLDKFLKLDHEAFIVMLSANSMRENILGALEKGAQGFVTKPFAKDKLMSYLHMCENSRRKNPIYTGAR